ncbi:DUF2200 family protein [Paradesertivirga mongoliensis]|uniref:DUF2200 family protein n=1 Tax=Paradesertivirga mongoliensis TaxID=2100740 RepID=UPI00210E90BA
MFWLTGYNKKTLQHQIDRETDFETFLWKHRRSIQMPGYGGCDWFVGTRIKAECCLLNKVKHMPID